MKIQHFTQLKIWQDSIALTKEMYILSSRFPSTEMYGLTSQMRRASASIGANIAEGFGRFSQKDKIHFYYIARGSLMEVEHFLYLSRALEYISEKEQERHIEQCEKLLKSLQSYGRQLKLYKK